MNFIAGLNNMLKKMYQKIFGPYRLVSLLVKEIENNWTILDTGCGRTSPLKKVNKGHYRVGIDFFKPYIMKMKTLSVHNAYVLADVRALPFKSKSFDCVVATEIIEHLSKDDGLKMFEEIENIAAKKIIMTTPNGFLPTFAGPEDNPDETHLCGYTESELKKLGFKVRGLNGLKSFWTIKDGQSVIKFRLPKIISSLIINLTEPFAFHRPSLAFQFFFTKDVDLQK